MSNRKYYIDISYKEYCKKCKDNNIPIANVDFELDILGEDVGVKIYCTNDQLKNLKINLLKYRENFYVKKVCRGFKSI